jgi:hypothetical protein
MKQKRQSKSNAGLPVELPANFAPIAAAFAADPEVKLGKMFSSNSVLNVNGKIFAMLVREKLVVKLPRAKVEELVSNGKGERFDPGHGRLMKEWVSIRSEETGWIALAQEAYRFVKAGK